MPADNHLDDRRKHESKGGATDRTDQGYEETQFRYRLCQDNWRNNQLDHNVYEQVANYLVRI